MSGYEYTAEDAVKAGLASLTPIYTAWTPTKETVAAFCRACGDLDRDAVAWAFALWAKTKEKPPTPAGIRKLAQTWEPPPPPPRVGPPDHEVRWAEGIMAALGGWDPSNDYDRSTVRTAKWVLSRTQ